MTLADTAAGMPLPHFLAWLGLAVFLTVFGLWGGFRRLHRARLIENVPTARVRSAPQGYVELVGTAEALPGEPIIAPLSGAPCCWYRYLIQARAHKSWTVVDKGVSDGVFVLRDDTGECLIDPEGGQVTSTRHRLWYGNSEWPDRGSGERWGTRPDNWHRKLNRLTGIQVEVDFGVGDGYRYTEEVILPGDPLYAVGRFHTLDHAYHAQGRAEIAADYLRRWKRHPEVMARFDANGDGRVDEQEWAATREQAEAQAAKEVRELQQAGPVHTLVRPDDGRPLLVANIDEFDLIRRYRWQGMAGIGLFFAAGATTVFMVSVRWLG